MHLVKYAAPANDQPAGSATSFCPNCGHPVAPDDTFCQNCGYNLADAQPTANAAQSATPQEPSATSPQSKIEPTAGSRQASQPRKPMSKKNKRIWWSLGILVVLIIAFFVWGNHYYSRDATLDRSIANIKSGKHLTSIFTSTTSSLKMTDHNLKPISKYYSQNPKDLASLKRQLRATSYSSDSLFTYGNGGHRLLFFPKYQITVKPVYPTVTTNHKGNVIKLDGKKIATATSDMYTKKLGPLAPGKYQLQASGTVSGHHIVNKGSYYISDGTSYDLSLKTISVTFDTLPSSTVYLNGNKLGTADSSGMLTMKNEPWSPAMQIYAKYKAANGTIKSKTTKLAESDDGYDVKLTFPGLMSQDDASSFIEGIFSDIDDLSNYGDDDSDDDDDDDTVTSDDDSDLPDYFESGTSNSDYQDLVKMAKGYYKDDEVDSTDFDTTVTGVEPDVDKVSLVTYTVKYSFYHDDSKHVQTFQYTATVKPDANDSGSYKISKISGAKKINDYTKDN